MAVSGTVVVVETETGLALSGALSGLEASVTGGLHIHEGTSCKKSDKVGEPNRRARSIAKKSGGEIPPAPPLSRRELFFFFLLRALSP